MNTENFPRMHVSLYVADIASTVNFYSAFFGQPAAKVKPGYAKYVLDRPSLIISFVENKERVQANFGHLGFQVQTAEELQERLKVAQSQSQSLELVEEMGTNCCYANQDKFWVSDPDGHQWEVYHFHHDVQFNDPHYALEDNEQCCMPAGTVAEQPKAEAAEKPKVALADLQQNACTPGSGCC